MVCTSLKMQKYTAPSFFIHFVPWSLLSVSDVCSSLRQILSEIRENESKRKERNIGNLEEKMSERRQ